jgi:hypothetical protein
MPRTRFPIKTRADRARRPRGRPVGESNVARGGATGSGTGRHPRPAARGRRLGRYRDGIGREREVLALAGAGGSVLVVDRDAAGRGVDRLVAHLAADEPRGNAELVCRDYLSGAVAVAGRCRPLTEADLERAPFPESDAAGCARPGTPVPALLDRRGCAYRLELLDTGMSIPELRWRRERAGGAEIVSVRDAVGRLESYEPVCGLSRLALARHDACARVSTTALRLELGRVQESPTVLNRRLREAVVASVAHGQLSMSEIAIRCGRVKRDGRGNESGETSWLARRLGLLPEGGQSRPTPWIHTDVLGLIARRGLGVSPREVEL